MLRIWLFEGAFLAVCLDEICTSVLRFWKCLLKDLGELMLWQLNEFKWLIFNS